MSRVSACSLRGAVALVWLVTARPAVGFKPNDDGHLGITTEALAAVTRTVDGRTLRFSPSALKGIRDANRAVDISATFFGVAEHFDDEAFAAATARLRELKGLVIGRIIAEHPDGASAREYLGGALHTLQDFYAHSSWVELGSDSIESALGRSILVAPPAAAATCPAGPGFLGGAGLVDATTGYFPFPNPCAHGATPAGKCRHGVNFFCPDGLNKDDPSRPGFEAARALAVEATTDFVDQILDAPGVAGNAKATAALMGVGTLGVVVDTTGSMTGVLELVKEQVAQIVRDLQDDDDEPSEYLLVPFNDPDVGGAFVTADADEFLTALDGLTAGDGDDCPELSMTGLIRAVTAAQPDSVLYLVTDGTAKDAALAGNVIAAASARDVRISPLLFGSCSPVDPAYVRIADETGGQLFLLSPSEAGPAFALVRPQVAADGATLALSRGELHGETLDVEVAVDGGVSSLTLPVSTGLADVDLFSFAGRAGAGVVAEVSASRIGSPLDAVLTLLDGDAATVIAASDDALGIDPRLAARLPHDGTFFLRVEGHGRGGADFFYDLRLSGDGGVPLGTRVEAEPNDRPPVATPIGIGDDLSGTLQLVPEATASVVRPSGDVLGDGDPGVTITRLSSGVISTVAHPEPGTWRIRLTGDGRYALAALAGSSILLQDVAFVERAGRLAHEGFRPIAGQPALGSTQTLLAAMAGPFATADFRLVDEDGRTIAPLALGPDPDAGPGERVGALEPPAEPFRVAVSGLDADGARYERVFPTLFRAAAVQVTPEDVAPILPAGTMSTRSFAVRNLGAPRTLDILATDSAGFLTRVQPAALALDAGTTAEVRVDLTLPADATAGTRVGLTVVASDRADPRVTNGASVTLSVVACPEACAAPEQCHLPGACEAGTGKCSAPAAPDGTPCDDADAATTGDTCRSGTCRGDALLDCDDGDACTVDVQVGSACRHRRTPRAFGRYDGGCLPPDAATASCESRVVRKTIRLATALLECRTEPREACDQGVREAFVATTRTRGCAPCTDLRAIAAGTASTVASLDADIHCAGAGGPASAAADPIAACQRRVARAVQKLAAATLRCHVRRAMGRLADDAGKERCEEAAVRKMLAKTTTGGCGPCTDLVALARRGVTRLRADNRRLYCASPSGAFLEPR